MAYNTRKPQIILIAVLFAVWPFFAGAAELAGRVVHVSDGDTLTLLTADKRQTRVRLSDIDTPEKRQAFGRKAKAALSEMVAGQSVIVQVRTVDRYKRTVGRVFMDDLDINAELVRLGMAWVYRRYSNDAALIELETQARESARGLWSDPNPTPPWTWRKMNR